MKRFYEVLGFIFVVIGLLLVIWGSINYTTYPNLIEIMKKAFAVAWIQYTCGLILIFGGFALLNKQINGNRKKK
jgi:hypothetical protein